MRRLSSEKVILGLYVLYIVNQILSASQFTNLESVNVLLTYSRYALFVLITLFAILHVCKKNASKTKFFLIVALLAAGLMNMLFVDGGIALLLDVIIVFSYKKKSLYKIFRVTFWTILLTNLFVVLCCRMGIIEDVVSVRWLGNQTGKFFAGRYDRHTYGFLVQNQIPNAFLILYLIMIVLYKGKLTFIQDAIVLVIDYFLFSIFGARISFVLTIVAVLIHATSLIIDKYRKRKNSGRRYIAPIVFVVSGLLSFSACLAYGGGYGFTRTLDLIFNNRLRLGSEAIRYYGIKLIGSGKTSGTYMGALADNTVDNGYILLFIQYGLIIGIFVLALWIYVSVLCNKSRYCTGALIIFALLNIVDSHLTSYMAIPFMCILLNQNDPLILSDVVLLKKRRRLFRFSVRRGRNEGMAATHSTIATLAGETRRIQ